MNFSAPKLESYFKSTNDSEGIKLLTNLMTSFDNIKNKISILQVPVNVDEKCIDLLTLFKSLNCHLNMDSRLKHSGHKLFSIKNEVLDSLLCLIKLDGISHGIRVEFIKFAFLVLKGTYEDIKFDKLVNDAFIFRFLKKEELIKPGRLVRSRRVPEMHTQINSEKDKSFDPSDDEIEQFFKENRTQFFKLMMSGKAESFKDPMADFNSKKFYHYYLTLEEQRNMMNSSQAEKTYLNVER
ncbi:MAG: hypothetical protein HRU18_14785 [Pseudoalteromonas sp.]|jgi:hypothetical protein|uniref:hypothetical protein n=1 Tax=Pseudoalteromonas sp. TaxID=53249 RepID=UPI001D8DE55F|nr:hypothetical protein [Pseudoalteromonas sp.]NRA79469.1 hypothetical protein [Pseudoalteromonas sp.]|tara:strand:- start:171 stop:887 length:717 start_codon:yes stop_codon:yes gene_type:complete